MEVRNSSISTQFQPTETAPAASGWKPGKIAGQVAGRIGSFLGFKANVASSEQQQDRVAQNSATKQEIESRIIAINNKLQSLPSKGSIRASDPLQQKLQEEALHNTKITLGQEKGRLLEQLANENYKLPTNSNKTSIPARSSSPTTVSRSPSPTTRSSQDSKQAELRKYQNDKKQIEKNERLMNQPAGVFSADGKSKIAQDTWDRQLRVEAYEKKYPEVLQQ